MLLKPWYDAYGGPYKDEYRFWTGFLLLVRCGLVLVMTFENDQEVALSILMCLCLILIPLVALLQVYNSYALNILEIINFSCILAMVLLVKLDLPSTVPLSLVMSISVCVFIGILFFHVGLRLKSTRVPSFLQQIVAKMKSKQNINEEIQASNARRNVPISIVGTDSSDEEREPLLKI